MQRLAILLGITLALTLVVANWAFAAARDGTCVIEPQAVIGTNSVQVLTDSPAITIGPKVQFSDVTLAQFTTVPSVSFPAMAANSEVLPLAVGDFSVLATVSLSGSPGALTTEAQNTASMVSLNIKSEAKVA